MWGHVGCWLLIPCERGAGCFVGAPWRCFGSILEHLQALVAQGSFHPVSLNCRAGKEPRSWFWLCLLTCFSEVSRATTSLVLHCSRSTEPVSMSSQPCGCDPFFRKGEGASVGAGSHLPAAGTGLCDPAWWPGPQADGSVVPRCSHCCHRGW